MSDAGPVRAARELAPMEWGRAVLEELLFRAAEQVSERGPGGECVVIELAFTIRADAADHAIEISTSGRVEEAIVTRVSLGPA